MSPQPNGFSQLNPLATGYSIHGKQFHYSTNPSGLLNLNLIPQDAFLRHAFYLLSKHISGSAEIAENLPHEAALCFLSYEISDAASEESRQASAGINIQGFVRNKTVTLEKI